MRWGTALERCVANSPAQRAARVPTIGTDQHEGTPDSVKNFTVTLVTWKGVITGIYRLNLHVQNGTCCWPWRPVPPRKGCIDCRRRTLRALAHAKLGEIKEKKKKNKRSEGNLNPPAKLSEGCYYHITCPASPS